MSKIFQLPFLHLNDGIPPKMRVARKFAVSATAPFSFPEADSDEMQPALMFRNRSERGGTVHEHCTPVMQCRGMLVRPVPSLNGRYDDTPLDEDGLIALEGMSARRMPKGLQAASASYYYQYGDVFEGSSINPAKVTKNGFREAVDEIQRSIDSHFVLVDGTLYSRANDPAWNFRTWGNDDWHVEALLAPSAPFTLPGGCTELVQEIRDWCRQELGREIAVREDTSIEVLSTSLPFAYNPIVASASHLAGRAELNVVNRDYFGSEVKALGQAFLAERNVVNAVAFISAFEEAAKAAEAHEMGGGLANRTWFDLFWKFYEVLPEGYKVDEGEDETLSISF